MANQTLTTEIASDQCGVLPLAAALIRGSGMIVDICDTSAAEHDITWPQAQMLCVIAHRPMPMSRLGEVLRINKSSTTGLIDRAEVAGLVERVMDPQDRRSQLVTLTRRGEDLGEAYRAAVVARLETLIADVPPDDREVLQRVLSGVVLRHQARNTWPLQ